MLIKLDQFAPDADFTVDGVATDMTALVPSLRGYKAAPSPISAGIAALASSCFGAVVARKLDNSSRYIAGTATKLYESGATWTDVSRVSGGDYSAAGDVPWRFAQFGNVTLATNKADTLQFSLTSGAFADVTGAPKAALVETVNQFVFLADTNDSSFGDSPNRWWCSAVGTYDDWTPDVDTQCVSGTLTSAPGRINAIKRLGDSIVMYKDRTMYIGAYVGAPIVWDIQEIPGEVGCVAQGGIVDIGTAHVFVGYENFYLFDGSRPTPIGNPLKDWFLDNLYSDFAYRIKTLHDRQSSNIYFFYPSRSGAGSLDSCIVYNYRVGKWGVDNRAIEQTVDFISAGLTFESTFATSNTFAGVDAGITFDSPLLVSGRPVPAYIDSSHLTQTLTGAGSNWSITTNDFGSDVGVSMLTRVRPRFLTAPTSATMTNYYRMVQGQPLTLDQAVTYQTSNGSFDVLRAARWHRLVISGVGGGEFGAMDVQTEATGSE